MADPTQILKRRDTTARWAAANPVLGAGEPSVDMTDHTERTGDGTTPYLSLPFFAPYDGTTKLPPASVMTAMDQRWGAATVNAKSFGATGDGVTNDEPAIQSAINAVPDGGTLLIPSGTYILGGTGLTNTNPDGTTKSIRVSMRGATLVKSGTSGRIFAFSGTWDATTAVTGVTSGTVTEASGAVPTVVVTHTGTMPWKRGDLVKLFSDDSIPGARDAESRSGQFLTVYSVSAGTTTFVGVLRDPLTTNVRMARLPMQTAHVEGGTLDVSDDYLASGFTGEMINMAALHGPSIRDLSIRRSMAQCITMNSDWGYLVENVRVMWAQNDGATFFGYGVNNNASEGGLVSGCLFAQTRHAYTDSNATVDAGRDAPSLYGRSVGDTIMGCVSDGATTTGFDTHQGGEGHTFIGCVAYGSPLGFALRGRKHSIIGCKTHGSTSGLRIFTESTDTSQTWGNVVSGFSVNGSTATAIEVAKNFGSSANTGVREARSDQLSDVRIAGLSGKAISILNATVAINDLLVEYTGGVPASICTFTNATVSATNQRWDLFNSSSGTAATLFDAGTSVDSRLEFDGVRIVGYSFLSNRIARVFQNTATSNLFIERLRMDYAPSVAWYTMTTVNTFVHWETVNSGSGNSTYLALTTVGASDLAPIAKTREDVVVEVTLSAAATIAALPQPQKQGQKLIIVNNSASAALTLTNGTTAKTQLTGATNKSLSAGQSILLESNTSLLWRQVTAI